MSETAASNRILCVDDEPRVLEGMQRTLGMDFEVVTAPGGAQALALLIRRERFALTISDMRMPGMDGAAYLERAAQIAPDMVRILLSGQSDMQMAVRAINYGRIFRFLTKPCDGDALRRTVDDALHQYRLITAEKELLQKTLYGCVKVLTELLSLVNPTAFARACRVKAIVEGLAKGLDLADPWQLELAVMLAHLGYVDMAPDLLERAYRGEPLSAADASLMESAPRTATGLLADIPRLEAVLGIVDRLAEPLPALVDVDRQGEGRLKWAAHVIKAAERADQLSQAKSAKSVIAEILKGEHFDERVTTSFAGVNFGSDEQRRVVKIKASELKTGMLLVEDARSGAGVLMAKTGQEVTPTLAVLLRRMASRSNLMEPLTVSEKVE